MEAITNLEDDVTINLLKWAAGFNEITYKMLKKIGMGIENIITSRQERLFKQ